jgi:hypothetical protein
MSARQQHTGISQLRAYIFDHSSVSGLDPKAPSRMEVCEILRWDLHSLLFKNPPVELLVPSAAVDSPFAPPRVFLHRVSLKGQGIFTRLDGKGIKTLSESHKGQRGLLTTLHQL